MKPQSLGETPDKDTRKIFKCNINTNDYIGSYLSDIKILNDKATTIVGTNKGPEGCVPGSECDKGEGDCDLDEDCMNGLVCVQRFQNIIALTITTLCFLTEFVTSGKYFFKMRI